MLPLRDLFDPQICWKSADASEDVIFFFTYQHISLINPQADFRNLEAKQKELCPDCIQMFGRSTPWQQVRRLNSTGANPGPVPPDLDAPSGVPVCLIF